MQWGHQVIQLGFVSVTAPSHVWQEDANSCLHGYSSISMATEVKKTDALCNKTKTLSSADQKPEQECFK